MLLWQMHYIVWDTAQYEYVNIESKCAKGYTGIAQYSLNNTAGTQFFYKNLWTKVRKCATSEIVCYQGECVLSPRLSATSENVSYRRD